MNNRQYFTTVIALLIILLWAIFTAFPVIADELPPQSQGVDAYTIMTSLCYDPLLGGVTIGKVCNSSKVKHKHNDTMSNSSNDTTIVDSPAVVVTQDNPMNNDNVPSGKTKKEHKDNGNHYGNSRPDNNSHDCKNKHDTACK